MNLDIFRGLAGLLMVFNHAGYAWLTPAAASSGVLGAWIFVTGMAPVLFFFATGVGMGWSGRRQPLAAAVWRKVGWLLLADLLLNWGQGGWWGLNFFGFIGLSMLVVAGVRATRRPVAVALLLLGLLLAARFAPLDGWRLWAQQQPWLALMTGIAPVPGVSYPLAPWLAYPLVGFVLAHGRSRWASWPVRGRRAPLWATAVLAGAASAALAFKGAVFHRWSTMSAAYFVASVAVLAAAWLLAAALIRWPRVAAALALRGPASLLVVPVHYAGIGVAGLVLTLPLVASVWWPLATALVAGALWLSRRLAAAMTLRPVPGARLHAAVAVAAVGTLAALATTGQGAVTLGLSCLAQTLVAWALTRTDAPARA